MSSDLKNLLLEAPDSQLDSSMKKLVKNWDSPPTSLQVLEVLDKTVHGGLGGEFTVRVLEVVLQQCINNEQTSFEEVVKKASWRNI